MSICLDCIKAATPSAPCSGVEITVSLASDPGQLITVSATAVPSVNALIGYDYVFTIGRDVYTIVYTGSQWAVLDIQGNKLYYSVDAGTNNNLCPPKSGWTVASALGTRTFASFAIDVAVDQGPSLTCLNSNGTFDANSTGWTVTNGAWATNYGGSVKFDTALLSSLTQTNVLTVGDTFVISLDYATSTRAGYCTPPQLSQAYLKVYAGTKVYTIALDDTAGALQNLEVELTCEGNTTLTIELYDPNQCYGSVAGGKGRYIDNVCAYRTAVGGTPIVVIPYSEIAEVPLTFNGVDYNTKLAQYQNCLAIKGTTFYNKTIGGVKCDYRELTKLKLITELLAQKDKDRALDCIYDRKDVVTATYEPIPCGVTGLTINTANPLTIAGDYTPFETFNLQVVNPSTSVVVASRKIIDVTFNSGTSQSTILLESAFSSTYSGFNICLVQNTESTTTYLETFINFANRFCADCSATTVAVTSSTGSTTGTSTGLEILATDLTSETGVDITTEFNQKITI
jgi:hypothetical protein